MRSQVGVGRNKSAGGEVTCMSSVLLMRNQVGVGRTSLPGVK